MNQETLETINSFKSKSFKMVNPTIHKFGGDPRLMFTAPCALLLQVAHPTVSAGVKEHSDYLNHPWLRLLRTLDFVFVMTYGDPKDMVAMGEAIKNIHTEIRGIKSDGKKYSALEPEAYAWVHATLAYLFVRGNELFGDKMTEEQKELLWQEWKEIGYLIHVQKKALPEHWSDFQEYFDNMIDNRLERTPEVDDLIKVLGSPPPPFDILKGKTWDLAMIPVTNLAMLVTAGMLPPSARTLLGLDWSLKHQLAFNAYVKATRALTPIMPSFLLNSGPLYIKMRRASIRDYYKY